MSHKSAQAILTYWEIHVEFELSRKYIPLNLQWNTGAEKFENYQKFDVRVIKVPLYYDMLVESTGWHLT